MLWFETPHDPERQLLPGPADPREHECGSQPGRPHTTCSSPPAGRPTPSAGRRRRGRPERPALLLARVRGPRARRPVQGPAFISREVSWPNSAAPWFSPKPRLGACTLPASGWANAGVSAESAAVPDSRRLSTLPSGVGRQRRCCSRSGGAANATPKRARLAARAGQSGQRRTFAQHGSSGLGAVAGAASATSAAAGSSPRKRASRRRRGRPRPGRGMSSFGLAGPAMPDGTKAIEGHPRPHARACVWRPSARLGDVPRSGW